MSKPLDRSPVWSQRALQGLSFWIGHRHALYPHYPLTEGALVAEACNLIYANLDAGEVLLCEQQYLNLVQTGKWPSKLGRRARADLVIAEEGAQLAAKENRSIGDQVIAAIEVKRASAPKSLIDEDLERLANFKSRNKGARAFLFVVAEAERPKEFVTEGGTAIRGQKDRRH